jgi:hypothetical protein
MLSMMTSVIANGFAWWGKQERGPRLFVLGCSVFLGALVAAAASSEMSGPWPAFVIGAGAPASIKGLLSGVELQPAAKPKVEALPRKTVAAKGSPHEVKEGAGENVH